MITHPHRPSAERPEGTLPGPRRHRRDIAADEPAGHVEHDGDPDGDAEPPTSALERVGWFVLLWLGGVATVTAVGYAIRVAVMP